MRFIGKAIAAQIEAPIDLKPGMAVTSIVDPVWRTNAMKNHTATHLLQAALIELFGKQIKQSGSLVHPDYLRFDFTYHENLSAADTARVEDLVNQKIRENIPVAVHNTNLKDALSHGALAFFGDKYNPEEVRMVKVSDFSVELCGGTHVTRTGDIGTFKITDISALSAGHRRITAVTGPRAIELFQQSFNTVKALSQEFKVQQEEVIDAFNKQKELIKKMQLELKQLKKQAVNNQIPQWLEKAELVNEIPFLFLAIKDTSHDELKDIAQTLATKKPGFYFLTSNADQRISYLQLSRLTFQLA